MKLFNTKKAIGVLCGASVLALCAVFAGCSNAASLHNQVAASVTIKFTNFDAAPDGEYAIPGDFDGDSAWERDNTGSDISISGGEGTSVTIPVTSSWMKFTLVETGDSSWNRSWYPSIKGNSIDGSSYWNFYIGDGDYDVSSGEFTIVVDGSTGTAVLTVE